MALLTSGAAGYLVFSHLFSVLFNFGNPRFLTLNLCAALAAALMCILAYRRQPIWVASMVLAWSIFECLFPVTRRLYGHFTIPQGVGFAVFMAVCGLIGAIVLRGMEKRGEFDRNKASRQTPLAL